MERVRTDNWLAGSNNIAPRDRLPEASIRLGVNVDSLPGGRLSLRADSRLAMACAKARGILSLGKKLLIADGADLIEFDTSTSISRVLRQIAPAGPFTGDVMNDHLYFSTANEALEYDGNIIRPWGVPDVLYQPALAAASGGALLAGYYQVAMTFTDQWGREGGTDMAVKIMVQDGGSLNVTVPAIPAGCKANLYVSSVNGETLYLQRVESGAGVVNIGAISDNAARCGTMLMRAPQPGHIVRKHNSMLVTAIDKYIQHTRPMRPHLVDRARSFYQYSSRVGMVCSANGTLYVGADQTYAITGLETATPSQVTVFKFPPHAGTDVKLPKDNAAWMTPYGQAVTGDGVALLNESTFAPDSIPSGCAGFLKYNGNNLIITVMDGPPGSNPLASTDIFIGEDMHQ